MLQPALATATSCARLRMAVRTASRTTAPPPDPSRREGPGLPERLGDLGQRLVDDILRVPYVFAKAVTEFTQ